ncbi:PAQR family membrane homeostasis protein TrhA [Lutispora thermophila]|uniref:Hemolysin III n=1 Tax=Lutispora thermophila DSM 19022 TaxID=1122184 RepID=A0A1M6B9S6_9FIRM|nr:hemolysin III family protein [Lutispora thermophila]SHI45489.1 hemolysin III [Lutispora thermophila DSM 19022]
MLQKLREPVSGLTHLIGAILSVVGMFFLVSSAVSKGSASCIVSVSIFGLSLILLYTASSLYHLLSISKKGIEILRKIDHMMIYILIAGTYTPVCLMGLKDRLGIGLLIGIWSLAIIGIILKLVWFNAPRWIYTSFYVLMGWIVIIAIAPLIRAIPLRGVGLLVAGGIFYTIGAIIYGLRWPLRNNKYFGFHEIFHIFVMLGSLSHYIFVLDFLA